MCPPVSDSLVLKWPFHEFKLVKPWFLVIHLLGWSCREAFVGKNGQTVFAPKGIISPRESTCNGETQVLANSIYCGPLSCDTWTRQFLYLCSKFSNSYPHLNSRYIHTVNVYSTWSVLVLLLKYDWDYCSQKGIISPWESTCNGETQVLAY